MSDKRIAYALPSAAFRKCFNRDVMFDTVDWTQWQTVINGFQHRFVAWYFDPLSIFPGAGGHEAYPVFCSLCALVDAFTHYEHDQDAHESDHYKEFLRKLNPVFQTKLSSQIELTRWFNGKWKKAKPLRDFADVFYAGVRCSLHHHGDLANFAGMSGTGTLAQEYPNAGQSTCGVLSFSIVVFNPWVFRDELRRWFDGYCDDLRDNPGSDRARRFRERFKGDFAITIPEPATGEKERSDDTQTTRQAGAAEQAPAPDG